MAKVARAWAPFFGIVAPAAYAAVVGVASLAVHRDWMVPGTGWGVIVAGVGLAASYRVSRAMRLVRFACAALLAGIAAGEGLLLAARIGVDDRASPPTMVALLLCAVLLATFDRPRARVDALAVQLLVGMLLAIALVSLITAGVNAEGLIPWYRLSRMPPMAAGAFIAVGASFLALVARTRWYETVYTGREDEKIVVLVLGIVTLLAVAMGAAAFVAMERNLEHTLQGTLANAVDDRAAILESVLLNRVTRASIVATRPAVVARLRDSGRDAAQARAALGEEAHSLLASGFSGVMFQDAAGQALAQAGELTEYPALEVPLEGPRAAASLAWSGGAFLLRVRMAVVDGANAVGTVVTEQPLDLLLRFQYDAPEIGDSAEWVLCGARDEERMACFPRRFTRTAEVLPRRIDGVSLPMDYALAGGTGVIVAPDYRRDRVIAGFAPVGRTGLGVVLKMRLDEFYVPLGQDLGAWWRWYFAVALAAALLVASQVRPVAQRLVQSERMSRERSEALSRSERALRELYASLADGIIVVAPEGTIEFVNPAAAAMFGYPPQEIVGKPVNLLMPPELREANRVATERFMREGTSNVLGAGTLVYPAQRRDGTRFDLEFSLAAMRQGDQQRLVAVVRDVTQRTALERMKIEFTATVSHELRTPLTSVMGSLELLREEPGLEGPAREMLEMAWRNSQRLALLVNDVIDVERIESGAMRFEPSTFELAGFLEEAVRLDQPYAAMHEVALRLVAPMPPARLRADRDRLLQVMANLVSNAAKFSPPRGEVEVGARVTGSGVRVEVRDRGRGIPEEFRARMFQRFSQADSSDERERGGTGLGLAICKAIVERSGGTIGFEDRFGGGTTFWFELPAA